MAEPKEVQRNQFTLCPQSSLVGREDLVDGLPSPTLATSGLNAFCVQRHAVKADSALPQRLHAFLNSRLAPLVGCRDCSGWRGQLRRLQLRRLNVQSRVTRKRTR
jgi:hypothetical protein